MKDWLFGKIAGLFGPKYVFATVRTLVAFIGGALYGLDGLDPGLVEKFLLALEQILNPLAVLAVAWVWSLANKKTKQP